MIWLLFEIVIRMTHEPTMGEMELLANRNKPRRETVSLIPVIPTNAQKMKRMLEAQNG